MGCSFRGSIGARRGSTLRSVKASTRRRAVVDNTGLARRIGQRLRQARLAAGLTQQQLAGERYTKAYVSALENGLSKPSMAALTYLAERLGVPPEGFIGEESRSWGRLETDLALAAGRWDQAVDAYQGLLEPRLPRAQRAELLRGLAEGLARLDRGPEAAAAAAEAVQLFTGLGREADAALSSYWLSCAEYQQENTVEAIAILRGILDKIRGGLRVEPDFELRLLMALSSNESRDGNHAVALAYLEEIRGLAERLDDRRRAAYLYDLAYSYRETGDYEAAIRAGGASLALFRAAEAELEVAALENDLALSYVALGVTEKAEELARSSHARLARLGDERWLAHILDTEARIALARGSLDEARQSAGQALALARRTSNQKATISALVTLGRAARAQGQGAVAAAWYEEAAALARRAGRARAREVLGEWAQVVADSGDHERAFELMREAVNT